MAWCDALDRKYLFLWWNTISLIYMIFFFLCSFISDVLYKLSNNVILLIAADMIVTRCFFGNLCGGEAFFHRHLRPDLGWGLWIDSTSGTAGSSQACVSVEGEREVRSTRILSLTDDKSKQLKAIGMTSRKVLFQTRDTAEKVQLAGSWHLVSHELMWEISSV